MLKSNLGMIKIEGPRCILKAELSTLLRALRDKDVKLTDEEINECVNDSKRSDEEIKKILENENNNPELEKLKMTIALCQLMDELLEKR